MNTLLSFLKSSVLQHNIFPLVILIGQTLLGLLLILKLAEYFSKMDFMHNQ